MNNFTTEQFEQMQENVRAKGFSAVQKDARELYGLKRGTVQFLKKNDSFKKFISDELLRKVHIEDSERCETTVINCTGFLSAPSLVFKL